MVGEFKGVMLVLGPIANILLMRRAMFLEKKNY